MIFRRLAPHPEVPYRFKASAIYALKSCHVNSTEKFGKLRGGGVGSGGRGGKGEVNPGLML